MASWYTARFAMCPPQDSPESQRPSDGDGAGPPTEPAPPAAVVVPLTTTSTPTETTEIAELAPQAATTDTAEPTEPTEPTELPPEPEPEPEPEPARTPTTPHHEVRPRSEEPGDYSLSAHGLYLNRELTWLNFNWRVLHESEDDRTALLERVKFLAIVSSNLDEFFMKRIGGLKQQVEAGMHDLSVDGRSPRAQILECQSAVEALTRRTQSILGELTDLLGEHGIVLATYEQLEEEEKEHLRETYYRNIFPLVTPQAMDPAHPFPFVSNLSLNLLVTLSYPKEDTTNLARVKVPIGAGIPRLIEVDEGSCVFVPLEEVMANNLDLLFPGMTVEGCTTFRVTRNANTETDEEQADDLLAMIESELRERRLAPIVRLEVDTSMSESHRGMLAAEFGLNSATDVSEVDGMMAMRDMMEIATLDIPELRDPPHHPVNPPEMTTDRNVFHTLRDAKNFLVFHPYESFSGSVERFLQEASTDPNVRAIKMTLYRTSEDSAAMNYLIQAARNGKQVAVALELKARFDEEANIRWASRLEEVGIHVTYGVVGLKTHCKVVLVVRQDYDGLRRYAHIGTGNYHSGTARLYGDLGLFTCDDLIGRDLTELFNYLTTGYKPKRNYHKLLVAPKSLKQALIDKINREIDLHTLESPGRIELKMNALEDADITRALYRASRAGVRVELIVRDTCRLRPGIPGLSDNARVISVVGRFLEHSRLVYFRAGGEEEYYIGSADCMKRNLESRVEVLVPVEDPRLRKDLRAYLDMQLSDKRSAWDMQSDGSYVLRMGGKKGKGKSCQQQMIEWVEKRHREATRLRRRKPRGVARRRR